MTDRVPTSFTCAQPVNSSPAGFRLANGASLSKQDQAELQRGRSSLLHLPSRKRRRASPGAERDSSPSTSTAARSQDRAARRRPVHEAGATSKPLKSVRCACSAHAFAPAGFAFVARFSVLLCVHAASAYHTVSTKQAMILICHNDCCQ